MQSYYSDILPVNAHAGVPGWRIQHLEVYTF